LSLSQKFQKESAALEEWLTTSEAELQQKNSCGDMPADIDAEVAWANVSSSPNISSEPLLNVSTCGQQVERCNGETLLKTGC